ncbi:Vi polysaccharide biosynthesis UDP-N-acetylglucosamine C-6 dehydrogenase TviB [Janibacter indicus]|uniref:Vi polysaccharide biosynthesis UDP-N-acetylglucosamine C-6 dehydrogenase TviB n=1 Tax=Janibacter indicus TaxID=857417 RepID=A0A7L9J2L8_9MICO|nr:Vi polysaccharide biosynthesis UDP-N-acetylglucosamine C-6 dehydrogenase TviB [Janibacter indicus]QOK23569.1 Vi polysaccharide biosynthesis UDP-N-acetylglucosamine C-6 dehydrogenase TviB [Janibacter indicus]
MAALPTDVRLGVIGLGYVGLPLAASFAKHYPVAGFDINQRRIDELSQSVDRTLEVSEEELRGATHLTFSTDPASLEEVNVYVVTTPTPIDEHRRPDLTPLLAATRTVAGTLRPGDVVVYESTVYPGATEEDCVPLLEELSGLTFNEDFYVGYSPERINPGDKEHRFETITKVTSGSTPEAARFVDDLYQSVVTAGTHLASSIKVAEAAKVIENTQRDVNIALVNELSLIFNRLGIDTLDVLEAAGTKWNFLPFRPGLVGGHCIGVDPYYLTHKAQSIGYNPEIISAGRRLNDSMGQYVADQLLAAMLRKKVDVREARVLVLGLTFKENTPDLRNTRVVDIVAHLEGYGLQVDVYDPWADVEEARHEYGIDLVESPTTGGYQGVLLAVAHDSFRELGAEELRAFGDPEAHAIFDLKGLLPRHQTDGRL